MKSHVAHDLRKGGHKQSRGACENGARLLEAYLQVRGRCFYISSLCFWPRTSQGSLKAVRHLLGHKSHRGMVSTKSIEFLIFEKVVRCLCNHTGEREGHWQLALFILNRINAPRPPCSLAQIALRKMLKSAGLGHPISPYYLLVTIVRLAIGTDCRRCLQCCTLGHT